MRTRAREKERNVIVRHKKRISVEISTHQRGLYVMAVNESVVTCYWGELKRNSFGSVGQWLRWKYQAENVLEWLENFHCACFKLGVFDSRPTFFKCHIILQPFFTHTLQPSHFCSCASTSTPTFNFLQTNDGGRLSACCRSRPAGARVKAL